MQQWILEELIYNEKHQHFKSNDAIIAIVLDHEHMQKTAQQIDAPDIFSRLTRAFQNEYLPAKKQFEMEISKDPRLGRFQIFLTETMQAIDNNYEKALPQTLMGVPDTKSIDTALTGIESVTWKPFGGSKVEGTPTEQAEIATEAAQGRAKSVLELINLFTRGVDSLLRSVI